MNKEVFSIVLIFLGLGNVSFACCCFSRGKNKEKAVGVAVAHCSPVQGKWVEMHAVQNTAASEAVQPREIAMKITVEAVPQRQGNGSHSLAPSLQKIESKVVASASAQVQRNGSHDRAVSESVRRDLLFEAAKEGNFDAITNLLVLGTSADLRDSCGRRPIDYTPRGSQAEQLLTGRKKLPTVAERYEQVYGKSGKVVEPEQDYQ